MFFKIIIIIIVFFALAFTSYRFGLFEQLVGQIEQKLHPSTQNIPNLTTPIPLLPSTTLRPIEKISSQSAAISILSAPKEATASQAFTISWYIQTDKIATISSTAIRYGKISKAKVLLPSDYAEKSTILKGPIPATFSAQLTIGFSSIYYYRAHALIDDVNVWSDEFTIDVKNATTSAIP